MANIDPNTFVIPKEWFTSEMITCFFKLWWKISTSHDAYWSFLVEEST